MGSPHSASVASSLKANAGFNTDYRGQRRQLFPSDYIIAASQSMYVEYAEGANENERGSSHDIAAQGLKGRAETKNLLQQEGPWRKN